MNLYCCDAEAIHDFVTPAKAGVQDATIGYWIPACAGMTVYVAAAQIGWECIPYLPLPQNISGDSCRYAVR
jgi:hypothetical protein